MLVTDIANMSIWKKEDTSKTVDSEFRSRSLEELDLTNRPINSLKRAGCRTVGDLLDLMDSESGLKSVRNLGTKSEAEILSKVQSFKESFKTMISSAKPIQSSSNRRNCVLMRPQGPTWYTKIEDYDIPSKSVDILHSCGVYYVADLCTKDFETEPSWQMVRSLFASIIAKAN